MSNRFRLEDEVTSHLQPKSWASTSVYFYSTPASFVWRNDWHLSLKHARTAASVISHRLAFLTVAHTIWSAGNFKLFYEISEMGEDLTQNYTKHVNNTASETKLKNNFIY